METPEVEFVEASQDPSSPACCPSAAPMAEGSVGVLGVNQAAATPRWGEVARRLSWQGNAGPSKGGDARHPPGLRRLLGAQQPQTQNNGGRAMPPPLPPPRPCPLSKESLWNEQGSAAWSTEDEIEEDSVGPSGRKASLTRSPSAHPPLHLLTLSCPVRSHGPLHRTPPGADLRGQ